MQADKTITEQVNPYVGPRTFEEDDKRFFYGREREARDLLAFVISEPLVLFFAQSGAGKSSLINTCLIPGLRDDNFHVLPVGRVGGNLPQGIGDVRNIFAFNLLSNLEPEADPSQFTQMLLTDYLTEVSSQSEQASRVLIIDQFEEIVTNHPDRWQDREDFFLQLQAAIQRDPSLWVVLSMREDHIASLEPYAHILPGGLRARFHMQRLKLSAAQTAVGQPAADAGKPFEKGVAKALVRNLSLIRATGSANGRMRYGEYVEPVQLQVVCYQLWENLRERSAKTITNEHVQELGNVDRALAAFYDTAVQEVVAQSDLSEIVLRNWFEKKLITEAQTRGTVYQGPEDTEGLPNDAVNQLANKYLLRSERRAGADWYELVHDRFVDPILQANAKWREEQPPIVRAALAWHESGRDEKWLMTAKQVKDELSGLDWRKLDKNVRAYAVACGRNKFQEQRREEILQTQLNKATSNIKRFTWVLGFLLIVAVFASILALFSADDARDNTNTAETAVANAVEVQADLLSEAVGFSITQSTKEAQLEDAYATIAAYNESATSVENNSNAENSAPESTAIATSENIAQATIPPPVENLGVIVFVRYPPNFDVNQGIIYRVNTDGSNERLLTSSGYSSRDPAWSPDGSKIIFSSNIDGDYEIYIMGANGEDPSQWRKLTDNSWDDRAPAWSPDGQWVAFYSDQSGSDQIYVMRTSDREVFPINQNGNFPAWAPDSLTLVFGFIPPGSTRKIATIDLSRSGFSGALTDGNDYWPSWSPDGSRIAYTRLINSQIANTIICSSPSCDDSFIPITANNNGAPDWSPDGSQIVFYNDGGDGVNIWTMDSNGNNQRQITFSGLSFDTQPKWSP